MKIRLCDFCKKVIRNQKWFVTIVVANEDPNPDVGGGPFAIGRIPRFDPHAEPHELHVLEMCEGCAEGKDLIKSVSTKALHLVPNIGALTADEIAELEKMP